MDAAEEVGGENVGARPTELMLNAVSGCTGIDIISIVQRICLQPTRFEMNGKGLRAEDYLKRFTTIHIHCDWKEICRKIRWFGQFSCL